MRISWTIKYLILLMHGATMKLIGEIYVMKLKTFKNGVLVWALLTKVVLYSPNCIVIIVFPDFGIPYCMRWLVT